MPDGSARRGANDLFKRNGLYYARLCHGPSGEPIEIALHGVLSDEQARAAIEALMPQPEAAGDAEQPRP